MPRGATLLDVLAGADQAIVTTTDWGDFTPELLEQARQWRVETGTLGGVNARSRHFPSRGHTIKWQNTWG